MSDVLRTHLTPNDILDNNRKARLGGPRAGSLLLLFNRSAIRIRLLPFNEFPQTNLEQRFTRLRRLWPLALAPGRHYPDRGGTTPSPT